MKETINSENQYNGCLTWQQFLFYEMKITAGLYDQGLDENAIIDKIVNDNLFQFPTERMSKRIAKACIQRIDSLNDDNLVYLLAHGSADVGKQINLYAMMKYNRVVWDFMITVIGEKYRTLDYSYSKKDINNFFFQLQEQNDVVASWTEQTINKIKQVLTKSLVECDYLDSTKSTQLNPITIAPELEDEIKSNNDSAALSAFNCLR